MVRPWSFGQIRGPTMVSNSPTLVLRRPKYMANKDLHKRFLNQSMLQNLRNVFKM